MWNDSFETPDGSRNFNTKFVPEFAPDGSINSVQSIARDITERKQMEETISVLAKFPSENPDPVLRVDLDGRLLYANEASFKFLTWKLQIGKKTPSVLQKVIAEALKEGNRKIIDTEHNQRFISFSIVPVVEEGYANLYGRDITEKIKAENEIREMSEDISLLADINSLANTGTDIGTISRELSEEIKRIYNCDGAAILLLDRTSQSLVLQNSPFNKQQTDKIESLLGQKLTGIRIKLSSEFMSNEIFMTGKARLVSSRDEINQVVLDYTENLLLHKHIPELVKLLGIQTIILIPLMSENKPVGLIEISSKNIFGQNTLKRLTGLSGNLANIITRKQTETLLKEREEMLRIINENVSDIIWRIDADTRITYLSPSVERILGYRPEEILGQPILNFIAKEYHHFAANNIRERASKKKENKLIYYEYEMVARDGRKIPIEVSSSAIRDDQGNLTGFAGVSRDISERKAAEIALKESERKYHNLFENMVQGAFYQDADGNLTDVNKAALEIFGISRAQFLDRTSMHPEWNVVDEKNRFLPGAEHPIHAGPGDRKEDQK